MPYTRSAVLVPLVVPQNILLDMQNNLYTQAPITEPEVVETESVQPGLYENLYSDGDYADSVKLLRWKGPMHKEVLTSGD